VDLIMCYHPAEAAIPFILSSCANPCLLQVLASRLTQAMKSLAQAAQQQREIGTHIVSVRQALGQLVDTDGRGRDARGSAADQGTLLVA
jgi:hypothetical protein